MNIVLNNKDVIVKKIKELQPNLKIEERDELIEFSVGNIETNKIYTISNFDGNPNIKIDLYEEPQLIKLVEILEKKPYLLKQFSGVKYDNNYEIVIIPIVNRIRIYRALKKLPIIANIFYYGNQLKITIDSKIENSASCFFYLNSSLFINNNQLTFTIENLKNITKEGIENDIRNILNSVLFDIEYSYNLPLEAVELDNARLVLPNMIIISNPIPSHELSLVFKRYVPELLQYYHLAEKIDYIPFKYLCYYHIIEYFLDRSAYHIASEQVKQILLKPDFHINSDDYISKLVNLFKKELPKNLDDKTKLIRVLSQYIDNVEFKTYLESIGAFTYFNEDISFEFSKTFILKKLDFGSDNQLILTLANRIYKMRNSIVHSNPDFEDEKATPFIHNNENIDKLNIETYLLHEITKNIITKSAVTK